MTGWGIIKGLGVTFKHFFETYLEDIRWWGKRYYTPKGSNCAPMRARGESSPSSIQRKSCRCRRSSATSPFLVYDIGEDGRRIDRCTSCGICAKVCPPQCIWIVRSNDPVTGKPIPEPTEFYIDVDICMNCGLCAEYCPFDAIKMDHDYEIASYNRKAEHIYNKEKLSKPASYYASIRPTNFAMEEAARLEKAARVQTRRAGEN